MIGMRLSGCSTKEWAKLSIMMISLRFLFLWSEIFLCGVCFGFRCNCRGRRYLGWSFLLIEMDSDDFGVILCRSSKFIRPSWWTPYQIFFQPSTAIRWCSSSLQANTTSTSPNLQAKSPIYTLNSNLKTKKEPSLYNSCGDDLRYIIWCLMDCW